MKSPQPSWLNFVLLSVFCAFVIGVLTWATDSYSPQNAVLDTDPARSYYNMLAQAFQSGQFNLKMETPPEMAKLADPYDNRTHTWDSGYWTNKLDTSYYKGKFYLYFGPTPVLTLFWPYAAITGHYVSDHYAGTIFFALGFLVTWWLLCDIRKRYFPPTSFEAFAPGIFLLGVVLCLVQSDWIHEVARASGFLFVMLALAGIWLTLQCGPRRTWWLCLASASYGLAIGSRPSLLFGAIVLLAPVLQTWFQGRTISRRLLAISALSAFGPILLIGLALMAYNDLRFDNPFEFGRHYMLTLDYDSATTPQFSLRYLWYDFYYYFLDPVCINAHFPFLRDSSLPSVPSGHAPELVEYGGILCSYPFIVLGIVLLIWKKELLDKVPALYWFILGLLLLFLSCAVTDCLVVTAQMFYELDFLPPLILFAFIGFLVADHIGSPARRQVLRIAWYVLLGYSLVVNALVNVKIRAYSCYYAGQCIMKWNQPDRALEHLQNAVLFDPSEALYHNELAVAYDKTGDADDALAEAKKAVDANPHFTEAQYNLGNLLYRAGQSDEAFGWLEKALDADPRHTNAAYAFDNSGNAWLLASNPDPAERNEPLSLKLAQAACEETGYKVADTLIMSAAVFGENGLTNEAISLAQKAIVQAQQNGESNQLQMAKTLLAGYQKNRHLLPSHP